MRQVVQLMMRPGAQVWLTPVSSRSTSPLADLLSHQYAQRWIQEQLTRCSNCASPKVRLALPPTTFHSSSAPTPGQVVIQQIKGGVAPGTINSWVWFWVRECILSIM